MAIVNLQFVVTQGKPPLDICCFSTYGNCSFLRVCTVLPWIKAVMGGNDKFNCEDQWEGLERKANLENNKDNFQCGIQFARPPDTGEYEPYVGQYPWIAQILAINSTDQIGKICVGTLISDQFVLMGASCLIQINGEVAKQVAIYLGRFNMSAHTSTDQPMLSFSTQLHIHPLWSNDDVKGRISQRKFDFALARLRLRIAPDSSRIRPICLPSHCDENVDIDSQVVDNCESTEYTDWTNSSLIPSSNLSVISLAQCSRIYRVQLRPTKVCSQRSMSICNPTLFPLMCKNNSHPNIFLLGANGWAGSRSFGCAGGPPIFGR